MNNKILILGKGFIGTRIKEELNCDITSQNINSFKDLVGLIDEYSPGVIINCVGHTGENVDQCEADRDKTLTANVFVPIMLAEAAFRYKIKLVHISSGCIYHFDYQNQKPISEDQPADFFDLFYSRTKIYSERALTALADKKNILILRIRIPLDNRPHPKNILTKLLSFEKILDCQNSLTYIPDFIEALKYLINIDAWGIYNVVNRGSLRYSELLDIYKKYFPDFNYSLTNAAELGLIRTNLILSVNKLEKSGFKIREIHEVLEQCIEKYLTH
ncbi:MAG: sugar nucleotide-binding protein [Candidatus Omnitrophica bacterium]|nr:sugar nucleotide-binding protein [Candidatus Omnitrophota bacterium]